MALTSLLDRMHLGEVPTHTTVAVWLFLAWALSEGAIHLLRVFQPGSHQRQRAGLTWLQAAYAGALVYGLIDSALLRWTAWDDHWAPFCYAGGTLVAAGLVLRLTARLTLGVNFSGFVQTYPEHRLVTGGVYGWVRHPAYTAFLGFLVGFPVCFGSTGSLLVSLGVGLPALVYRIQREEAALLQWFGDKYRAYQRKTKRLLPLIW